MKIYLDTSVFGGLYDDNFSEDTSKLFDLISNGNIKVIVSDVLLSELEKAPHKVRETTKKINNKSNFVKTKKSAAQLAEIYMKEGALGKKSRNDAKHIAIATIEKVDVIVSWNFKHMVNFLKLKQYNYINVREGYDTLDIHSPSDAIRIINAQENEYYTSQS